MEKKNKWYHPFKKEDHKKKEREEKEEKNEPATPKDFPIAAAEVKKSEWKLVFKIALIAAIAGIVYLIYIYEF